MDIGLYVSFAVRTIETMRASTDNAAVKTTLENLVTLCGGQDEFINGEVARALALQVGLTLEFISYKILENFVQNEFCISRKNTPCFAKFVFHETGF